MHLTFDARGHLVAFAYFMAILLVLCVVFVIQVRKGRVRRRRYIAGTVLLAVAYVATFYGWLFWSTFFDLRVDQAAGRAELTMRFPERRIVLPLAQIDAIRRVHSGKPWLYHLRIDTEDGRSYESPQLSANEVEHALETLRPLGKDP